MKPESKHEANFLPDAEGLATILDSLGAGICRIDNEGRIIYVNSSAAEMLGRKKDAIVGMRYPEIFFGAGISESDPVCAPIQFAMEENEVTQVNTEDLVRPDGSRFLVELVSVPICEDGETQGAVLSFSDISDRREIEAAFSDARERALEAARSKAEFLANMSHEVRTPLTGIIGTVELLSKTQLDPDQRDYLRMLTTSTEFLHEIVNEILDYSKIEAGKFQLRSEAFSPEELGGRCVDPFRSLAANRNIGIDCETDPMVPGIVRGDPKGIQQVLNNLLSNALKFTDQGSVKLKITPGASEDTIRFSVTDTGIGISETNLEKVFSPFSQADSTDTRRHEGTGLGLAISEKIVRLMGGKLSIESEVGKGTKIWFEIPLAGSESDAQPEFSRSALVFPKGHPPAVLVVEDNPISLRVMKEMLSHLGIESDSAESGAGAVEACRKRPYDLVFMDCQMPDMDGFETAKRIKDEKLGSPAIIAFSAAVPAGEAGLKRDHGMDGLLRKPFMEKDLIDVLNAHSGFSSRKKSLDLSTEFSDHSVSQYVEPEVLQRLAGLDSDDPRGFLVEIFEVFALHASENLDRLREHMSHRNREEIKSVAHNLRGSSANIGIHRLAGLLEELENCSLTAKEEELKRILRQIKTEFKGLNSAIAEFKIEVIPQ
ncbi:MAG: ATP-binding protein [Acidobacteriota bacterium]|nr:ATP-binding protein [Acidobacteriota bacterium]MDH3528642.1 ATP-binding protein [Acidobacteriota bacterium]